MSQKSVWRDKVNVIGDRTKVTGHGHSRKRTDVPNDQLAGLGPATHVITKLQCVLVRWLEAMKVAKLDL